MCVSIVYACVHVCMCVESICVCNRVNGSVCISVCVCMCIRICAWRVLMCVYICEYVCGIYRIKCLHILAGVYKLIRTLIRPRIHKCTHAYIYTSGQNCGNTGNILIKPIENFNFFKILWLYLFIIVEFWAIKVYFYIKCCIKNNFLTNMIKS